MTSPDAAALRSVHTSNLPALLAGLQASLVVSTYQAGKLIVVRDDGGTLNTHFRSFVKPMGVAADGGRLAVGGGNTVWDYRNMPAVAGKLEPTGKHDACYLPRRVHVTGDIDVHELAFDGDGELWVVNTRFGCLCTLDEAHSFHPRWRPPFLSALAPEDRCHLNGLAMVEGRPRYVTALGETDTAGGWRADKAKGGVLVDVEANEVVLRGLSMPHSPRWHRGRLWLLESGRGSLVAVDLDKRSWKTVAEVPGFTRGLDFLGPLAFVGLSQIRETAVFSGLPLLARLGERTCGVWVVHVETGETVGFLRFEEGVQEIFAVQALRGSRFPEVLELGDERLARSYVLPDAALAQVVVPSEDELARSPAFQLERGGELRRRGLLEEAIAAYRRCLALEPGWTNARYGLGVALGDAGEHEAAIACMRDVTRAEPERAEAYNALGYLSARQRRPGEAVVYYERAIELEPKFASAHFNLGLALLQLGDYRRGFAEYEWRWRTGQLTPFECPHPRWDGRPIPEQTLLVHTEQGTGDAILLARYLPLAARLCKQLVLVCRADLIPLFATLPGVAQVREGGSVGVAEFDVYLPLLSLPHVLGTTARTIPAAVPYLDVEALRRRRTGEPLALRPARSASGARRVGVAWAGSPTQQNDRARSCALRELEPLLRVPGNEFHSLQKGPREADLTELPAALRVQALGPSLRDWGDTALAVDRLDLVIAVDTSVAHLAGALGKPVWTLLPWVSDWRWGLEGESTPWYPTMRLFRQSSRGAWGDVVQRLVRTLGELGA